MPLNKEAKPNHLKMFAGNQYLVYKHNKYVIAIITVCLFISIDIVSYHSHCEECDIKKI